MSESLHISPSASSRRFSEPRRCRRSSGGSAIASGGGLRNLILNEAERLCCDLGHQTTLTDIARELSIPRAAIGRFFSSRDAIADAVAQRLFDMSVKQAFEAAMRHPSAITRLRAFITTLHALAGERRSNEPRLDELTTAALTHRWDAARDYIARVDALLATIVAHGMDRGEFRRGNPDQDGRSIRIAVTRFIHPGLAPASDSGGPSFDLTLEHCLAVLRSPRQATPTSR